ncbi:hypothetical protein EVAR_46836_1 [Eumeta japonica]|uniref:Uncharacterized protein n=1 Tax=Eumeta variegata TaxID=151549 RepID=A0A4C2A9Z9_EUMVA|nr:hypothetical protein EVAR_46836_1 [Eumeta japonica]
MHSTDDTYKRDDIARTPVGRVDRIRKQSSEAFGCLQPRAGRTAPAGRAALIDETRRRRARVASNAETSALAARCSLFARDYRYCSCARYRMAHDRSIDNTCSRLSTAVSQPTVALGWLT